MATEPGTQEPAHAPARLKRLQQAFAAEHFREQIDALAEMTHSLLDEARGANSPVTRWTRPRELREQLEAVPVGEVQQLFDVVAQRSIRLQHPRFLGHQISPPAPIAAAAALLVDLLNNGMGVYEMGMAGTVMEREVVSLLAAKYGFPAESAAGFFTSGGSLANLTALLAARARMVPNAWAQGCPHGTILVSAAAHYCVDRAVRIMGWGEEGLTRVPVDDQFRMRTDLLESCFRQATDQGRQVVAVVGSSCCTSTGSFDDLVSIADFCQDKEPVVPCRRGSRRGSGVFPDPSPSRAGNPSRRQRYAGFPQAVVDPGIDQRTGVPRPKIRRVHFFPAGRIPVGRAGYRIASSDARGIHPACHG